MGREKDPRIPRRGRAAAVWLHCDKAAWTLQAYGFVRGAQHGDGRGKIGTM